MTVMSMYDRRCHRDSMSDVMYEFVGEVARPHAMDASIGHVPPCCVLDSLLKPHPLQIHGGSMSTFFCSTS